MFKLKQKVGFLMEAVYSLNNPSVFCWGCERCGSADPSHRHHCRPLQVFAWQDEPLLEEARGRNKAYLREADLEPLDYDLDVSREVQTGLTLVLVLTMVQYSLLHCVCR